MKNKPFKIPGDQIKRIIQPMGTCIASDKITVDGFKVGYMVREMPSDNFDSGWIFMSGFEDQEYADNPDNLMMYDVNTIANYDSAIIPYLHLEPGVELERDQDNTFTIVPK